MSDWNETIQNMTPHPQTSGDPVTKRDRIRFAMKYRSGQDSINSVYMGSMEAAGLYHVLGLKYGQSGFDEALNEASGAKLDVMMKQCARILAYADVHPTTRCPCCGQVIALSTPSCRLDAKDDTETRINLPGGYSMRADTLNNTGWFIFTPEGYLVRGWGELSARAFAAAMTMPCQGEDFKVTVETMPEADNRFTYWVCITRPGRPVDALPGYDGRITPFMSTNKEFAEGAAQVWRNFFAPPLGDETRQPNQDAIDAANVARAAVKLAYASRIKNGEMLSNETIEQIVADAMAYPKAYPAVGDPKIEAPTPLAAPRPVDVPAGWKRWRHVKQGTTYTEVGRAQVQQSYPFGREIGEGDVLVVYRSETDGSLWCRPVTEFEDGRFEALPATAAPDVPVSRPVEEWRAIDENTPLDSNLMLGWWAVFPARRWETEYGWAGASNTCGPDNSNGWRHGEATHFIVPKLPAPPLAARDREDGK